MSDLFVRAATTADADTITQYNLAMALETENRQLDPHTVQAGVLRLLTDPTRGVYYVAERDGNVVGQMMITYEWSDWRDGVFWWIQSVYVRPDARGSGIYRRMHEWVELIARRNERICGLRLYVEQENRHAQRVYERMGMHCTDYRLYEIDWASGASTPSRGVSASHPSAAGESPEPVAPAGGEIHIDLYCLKCGYNLRGLSGDPCRCPECGNLNPRGDMELPAELITRQLREMESGPAFCVGALVLLGFMGILAVILPPVMVTQLAGIGMLVALGCVAAWIACMIRFARSCLEKPGWVATLLRYHAAGLISIGLVVALPIGSAWLMRKFVGRVFDAAAAAAYTTFMIAVAALIAAGLYAGVKPLQRLAKGKMEILQREVAVEIARRSLRRRLAGKSWSPLRRQGP